MSDNQILSALIDQLVAADDAYYNDPDGVSVLTDAEYDELKFKVRSIDPTHPYLSNVGASVRIGTDAVPLPYQMGSLDQLYTESDIVDWLSLSHDTKYVLLSKMDGISVELIYYNGTLTKAYTRGDGYNGLDITQHVKQMVIVPSMLSNAGLWVGKVAIRAELIMKKDTFATLFSFMYKTPRSLVSGVCGRSEPRSDIHSIDAVAYEIMATDYLSKTEMLQVLQSAGFSVPRYATVSHNDITSEMLSDWIAADFADYPYEVDGVVIEADTSTVRNNLYTSDLNPLHAKKYKIVDPSNVKITTVVNVIWRPSQYAYVKPRIQIEPVELFGNTITFFSGSNARMVNDRKIGPGAVVKVTKSGGTIPYILEVMSPSTVPDYTEWFNEAIDEFGEWEWISTGADIKLITDTEDVEIRRIARVFTTLQIAKLAYGNVRKLYNAGYNSALMIMVATKDELYSVLGENANMIHASLQEKLNKVTVPELMGALAIFGRGMGTTRCELMCDAIGTDVSMYTHSAITNIPKFDDTLATQIMSHAAEWLEWFETYSSFYEVNTKTIVVDSSSVLSKNIVFTGFRNNDLKDKIKQHGGKLQSGVTSNTDIVVCLNPNEDSGKLNSARAKGITIMSLQDFRSLL
jgi:DNA ligase (NAD+)